jgi:hypothetical protein
MYWEADIKCIGKMILKVWEDDIKVWWEDDNKGMFILHMMTKKDLF